MKNIMMRSLCIVCAVLAVSIVHAAAVTTNVTTAAELVGAVAAVDSGSTIVLASGIYDLSAIAPTTVSGDNSGASSIVAQSKKLYFVGEDTTSWRETGNRTTGAILKGSNAARIFYGYGGNGRSSTFAHITFDGGVAPSGKNGGAIFFNGADYGGYATNCVFRNCSGTLGGATYDVTAYDCLYEDNVAIGNTTTTGFGGAAHGASGGSRTNTFMNSEFRCNAARYGGAIYCNVQGRIVGCNFITNSVTAQGGAIYAKNSILDASSVISNCTFAGNVSTNQGGAVYASANVVDCKFLGNKSNGNVGGAAYSSTLIGCAFVGNESLSNRGGAVSSCTVYDSAFTNNICGSSARGGAGDKSSFVRCSFTGIGGVSVGSLDHCIFDGVMSQDDSSHGNLNCVFDCLANLGGGIYATNCLVVNCKVQRIVNCAGADGEFVNCTFADNIIADADYTVQCGSGSVNGQSWPGTIKFANCLFSGNKDADGDDVDLALYKSTDATDNGYCFLQFANCLYTAGLINQDKVDVWTNVQQGPAKFVAGNPEFPDEPYYAILRHSKAQNAGLNAAWMTSATDLAGRARILEDRVDIGCYECDIVSHGLMIVVR